MKVLVLPLFLVSCSTEPKIINQMSSLGKEPKPKEAKASPHDVETVLRYIAFSIN